MKYSLNFISHFTVTTIASLGLCLTAALPAVQTTAQKADTAKSASATAPAAKTEANATGAANSFSTKDKDFMQEAAKGGMMEVDMGKMAQQQGKSAEVKKIGSRMVADHSKANNELMAIAKKKGVNLLNAKSKMEKMDSANFDKEYVSAMVKDHEKDLAAFQAEAKNGSDPEVKAFASKTSEVIKKHLAMVKEAQAKMK